jgi:hypothetical protein
MWADISIKHVHFTPAGEGAEHRGCTLVGFIAALFGHVLIIDGFRLVCRESGKHSVLFPTCRTGGKVHRIVLPNDRRAHREIESRLLDVLRAQGVIE